MKKKCTQEEALRRTDDLIQRHLQENPWSGYLISSLDIKEIKGLWLLESVEPGVLLISALIREDKMEKKEMREGIKTQAWKWTVKALLPLVDDMNVKVIGKPLEESCLRIVIHEHYPAVKQGKFEDEGFICKSKDGLLRHYEYPVKQLFQRQLETIHECLVE
ncbi:MAG: hypothetical protein KGJ02_01755 [Verrucomicrobiota bacterium]|nr:hypothetical protein [Verrucomicrobiota bacterium]